MTPSRTRVTSRLVAGIATTALLGAGLACAGTAPVSAATTADPLGFYVSDLSATPDGGAIAVGSLWDEASETSTPHAALLRNGEVVPVTGIPADASLNAVGTGGEVNEAVLGGSDDAGAAVWTVDLSAETPTAELAVGGPAWSEYTAITTPATVLAGTVYDDETGDQRAVALNRAGDAGPVELAAVGLPRAAASGADGTSYVVGTTGYDGDGALWVLDSTGALDATYGVGAEPAAVATAAGVAYVAGTAADVEEIRAIDGSTGETLGSVDFDTRVSGLATSADGETLFAAAGYELYAIPTATFADFDAESAEPIAADDWLRDLAISEQSGATMLYSAFSGMDEDSIVAFGAPDAPVVDAAIDPSSPTTLELTLPGEVDGLHAKVTAEGGAVVFDGALSSSGEGRQCSYDWDNELSTCWIEGLAYGTTYQVVVSATNFLGSTSTEQSVTTLPLLGGPASASFTGTAQVGGTLTAVTSTGWPEGTTLEYGWGINGGQWGDYIEGRTLTVTPHLAGTHATLIVTGTREGFAQRQAMSAPVLLKAAPPADLPALPVTKKAVAKVAGTAKVGSTLKAKVGTWPKGTKIKVQWLKNGKKIKGATKKKLKLTKKLKGKKISVVVTGIKPGYAPKVKKSKAAKVK